MRISDWSSDVCSSDLRPASHVPIGWIFAHDRITRQKQYSRTPRTRLSGSRLGARHHAAVVDKGVLRMEVEIAEVGEIAEPVEIADANASPRPRDRPRALQLLQRSVDMHRRSEERRVGKECGDTSKFRGLPHH